MRGNAKKETEKDKHTMKKINDNELDFVLHHYRQGSLDTRRAWQRFLAKRGLQPARSFRRIAVAASVTFAIGIAVAAGLIGYRHYYIPQGTKPKAVPTDSAYNTNEEHGADTTTVFHYDNTPINSVLNELSRHYGVKLSTNDTTKSVSGEIEAASADDAIDIIEATMNIKISKKP